ncbi:hypothetical protein BGX27_002407 [Mortierella sp. AM989]|nr:hypothetical protein BGX27_002407 [Mortierella sp. AM989]
MMATDLSSKAPFKDSWNAAEVFYTKYNFKNRTTAKFNFRKVLSYLEASGSPGFKQIREECDKKAFKEKEMK